MPRRLGHKGVTLVELLIVMAIITFVITASSRMLSSMLTQFKQQTKIAETSIESLIGLQILRRDLFSIGFGIPHSFQNPTLIAYSEADTSINPAKAFNDSTNAAPRAFIANTPAGSVNGSDYMVIKSLTIADNSAAGKFHFLTAGPTINDWTPDSEDLQVNDRVLVLFVDGSNSFALAMKNNEWRPGGSGTGQGIFQGVTITTNFTDLAPVDDSTMKVIYGVNNDPTVTKLRFPFNRADYYLTDGSSPYTSETKVPERCAPGTGVLVKAILNQKDGKFDYTGDGKPDELPLMDCVLDFQVGVRLDTDEDGEVEALTDADVIDDEDAEAIRKQLKEVRVYILAHEGQYDPSYEQPSKDFFVGELGFAGGNIDLEAEVGEDWSHYRWRLYTLVVQPESLNNILKSTE